MFRSVLTSKKKFSGNPWSSRWADTRVILLMWKIFPRSMSILSRAWSPRTSDSQYDCGLPLTSCATSCWYDEELVAVSELKPDIPAATLPISA